AYGRTSYGRDIPPRKGRRGLCADDERQSAIPRRSDYVKLAGLSSPDFRSLSLGCIFAVALRSPRSNERLCVPLRPESRSTQGDEIMATMTTARPPFPPFTRESAIQKVRLAEDAWNSRDPGKVALAYALDSRWRNRSEFVTGRNEIIAFLS